MTACDNCGRAGALTPTRAGSAVPVLPGTLAGARELPSPAPAMIDHDDDQEAGNGDVTRTVRTLFDGDTRGLRRAAREG